MRDELVFGGDRASRASRRAKERDAKSDELSVHGRRETINRRVPHPSPFAQKTNTRQFDLEFPPLPSSPPPVAPAAAGAAPAAAPQTVLQLPNVLTISMPVQLQEAISRIHFGGGVSEQQLVNQCYIFAVMRCLLVIQEKEPRLLTTDCKKMFESLTNVSEKNKRARRADKNPVGETDRDVKEITSQENLVELYVAIYHEYFYNTPWDQEKDRTLERGSAGRVVSAMAQAGCFNEEIKIYLTGDKDTSFGAKVLGSVHLKTLYHGLYYEFPKAANLGDNVQVAFLNLQKGFTDLTRELLLDREYDLKLELLGGVFSIVFQGEARKHDHYYWFDDKNIYNDTVKVDDFVVDTTKNGVRGLCDDLVFFFKISVNKEKVNNRESNVYQILK